MTRGVDVTQRRPGKKPTAAEVEKILRLIRIGAPMTAAAGSVGVSPSTLYAWKLKYPGFAEDMLIAREAAVASKVAIVSSAARGRDKDVVPCPKPNCDGYITVPHVPKSWQAAAWWLERTHHKEFGRKDILESKIEVRVKVELTKLAMMVVNCVNEEVRSVSDRERVRERILERIGVASLPEDPDGRQAHADTGRPALSP